MFNNKKEIEINMDELMVEHNLLDCQPNLLLLLERIEALENPPKFKRGDIVSYFLADKEIIGEIISQDKDITTKCYEYDICYLDKNDVIQRVTVNEKDLFLSGEDDIYERLEDLECQVEFLANELNKLKKK